MKRFFAALLPLLLAPAFLLAQDGSKLTEKASCSTPQATDLFWLVRGSTTDLQCSYSAVESTILAGALTFKTLDAPAGTDPVADSSTDTLALTCAGGITCTGDSSTDTVAISTSGLAPFGQYDTENPNGCSGGGSNVCEEWTGDAEALTWAWGNQEGSTLALEYDGATLTGDGADNDLNVRWVDPPSSGNVNFTIQAKIWVEPITNNTTSNGCGIIILEAGTTASPTDMTALYWLNAATDGLYYATFTDYAFGSPTTIDSTGYLESNLDGTPIFLQLRYTDATRSTTARIGLGDERGAFDLSSTTTLSADPVKVGFFARQSQKCHFEWFRARTDNTASPFEMGE